MVGVLESVGLAVCEGVMGKYSRVCGEPEVSRRSRVVGLDIGAM